LMARFGRDAVFQDVVAIVAGESFPAAIEAAPAQADVVLAVIGPRWLDDGSTEVSRLSGPNDYVRREVSSALGDDKRIIPVLVGDAVMPDAESCGSSSRRSLTADRRAAR
jgi:TIR domain